MGSDPSDIHLLYIGADRTLWVFDRGTSKMLKFDLEGHFLYSFGTCGRFSRGGFWAFTDLAWTRKATFTSPKLTTDGCRKFQPRRAVNSAFLGGEAGLLSVEIGLRTFSWRPLPPK